MATFAAVTEISKEDDIILDQILCIYYPIWFNKNKVWVLYDSGNKINVMTPVFASKLVL